MNEPLFTMPVVESMQPLNYLGFLRKDTGIYAFGGRYSLKKYVKKPDSWILA